METATLHDVTARTALADRLHQAIDDADRFLATSAAQGDEKIAAMRDKVAGQVRVMRAQLEEWEEGARDRARQAARTADRTVHEHPYSAIGVAAALGLLVGFLAARR